VGKGGGKKKGNRLSLNMELEQCTFVRNLKNVNTRSKRGESYSYSME